MKYRSLLLHTCWCIVFECLNSNLYLNSFGWLFSKIKTISFSLYSPFLILARSLFEPSTPRSGRAPSTPGPARRLPPPLRCRSAQCGPMRPSTAAARPLPLTGGPCPSSPTSGQRPTGGRVPTPSRLWTRVWPQAHTPRWMTGLFKGRPRSAVSPSSQSPSFPEPPSR
jgi:hypothetical protein